MEINNKNLHKLEQEKFLKELKKKKIEIKNLHGAGGFIKKYGFVYEPLGKYRYVFKLNGLKGIGIAKRIATLECKCGTITKKEVKKKEALIRCICGETKKVESEWILDIGVPEINLKFDKNQEPFEEVIFFVPNEKSLEFWLNNYIVNEKKEINEKFVFNALIDFFKEFFVLPIEDQYKILALASMQSYLTEIIDVVFYLSIGGETGSGKTALLEALAETCRHGLLSADISASGIARCVEKFKLSLMIDEIDKKEGEDIEGICRQGYRKGQVYIRMKPKTYEPQFFKPFGFKAFSYRSGVSDDLQNRSFEISLKKTKNVEIPVKNLFRKQYIIKNINFPLNISELLFFWYLDNIKYIYSISPFFNIEEIDNVSDVNSVNKVYTVNVNKDQYIYNNKEEEGGENIYIQKPVYLHYNVYTIYKSHLSGRNVELAYISLMLLDLFSVNEKESIVKLLEEKQEFEEGNKETSWMGLLKDVLRENYNFAKEKEGVKYVIYRDLINRYIMRMREIYHIVPSDRQIKKMLKEIGFINGINKKLIRIGEDNYPRLCLIYDKTIKDSLNVE